MAVGMTACARNETMPCNGVGSRCSKILVEETEKGPEGELHSRIIRTGTAKVALVHPSAMMLIRIRYACFLVPMPLSVTSSAAAEEIYAMEPKYQWSALSCCWHALLQLFFVNSQSPGFSWSAPIL